MRMPRGWSSGLTFAHPMLIRLQVRCQVETAKVVVAVSSDGKYPAGKPNTRGVDVGSIEFIHQQIVAQRDRGVAVLLVSAELDEILTLSDRIAVIYEGEIIATVDGPTATREQIGLLMAGVRSQDLR